jgi:NAD-dependent dihydropyrimidine dehydrogenase PreA subunit
MPLGRTRDKVLYGIGRARARPHRYTLWRWVLGVLFTVGVAALPLGGILRFDLWGGRHLVGGRELGFVEAARAFAFPFLAINIAIIVISRFLGRYLCGFVCPYGSLARLQEWLRFRSKTRAQKLGGKLALLGVCAVLSAITFSFWVDWRVFRAGSPSAVAWSGAFLTSMIAVGYATLRRLGLAFCRDWCPSGVYFALLGHDTLNGVEFAHHASCTECKACEKVCPMDLLPRELSGGAWRAGSGLYSGGLSNFALCIRCGDCVDVCEATTARSAEPVPLRLGWLPPAARDSRDPSRTETRSEAAP